MSRVRVEGVEPTFTAPFTITDLEGRLGYIRILFCSLNEIRTHIIRLGNACPVQLNDVTIIHLKYLLQLM